MMLKRLLSLLFWVQCGALRPALAQLPDSYNDLKIIYNIDSLEKKIEQFDKNSDAYYWGILTLEKSRETFRSCFIGKYANEIDRFSKNKEHQWGIAYANYLMVLRNLILLNGNPFENIKIAEKALSIFEQQKDKEAEFLTHMLFINCHRLQLNKYGLLFEKKEYLDIAQKTQKETIRLIEPHLDFCNKYILNCTDDLFKIKFYIFKVSLWNTLWLNKQNNDSSLAICEKIIETIGNNKSLEYFKADALNLKGNIYFSKNSLDLCIAYHLEALKYIINSESNLNVLINSNIGSEYCLIQQSEKAKPYLNKCIEHNRRLGNIFPASSALAYQYLAREYYATRKQNYQTAYNYLDSFIQITEPLNNQSRLEEFKNFKTHENLNEKIQKEKILEIKNRQSQQGLIAVSVLILLLAIILIGVIISRKKLNKAYQQIQELQHSREKFYSIVAHDLKSPLNSYQGLANTISYLLKKKEYGQIENISRKIDDNGAKIEMMMQNLFQWSLSEQQNLEYIPQNINLNKLYKDVLPVYHHLSENKSIGILEKIKYDGYIFSDPNYLSTILRNLLDNAIKNSEPNSIIQFISEVKNNKLSIKVINLGFISSKKLISILNILKTTKPYSPGEEGIGLGLILIRDFTKAMNGEIDISHTKTEIIFELRLPLNL